MYILTALIALFQMIGSPLTGNAWTDAFLDKMVGVETMFMGLAWWIWGIAIVLAIAGFIVNRFFNVDFGFEIGIGCGCAAIILLVWPLLEMLSVFLVSGVADNFNPETGVTNPAAFIIYLLLYLSLGAG